MIIKNKSVIKNNKNFCINQIECHVQKIEMRNKIINKNYDVI